MAKKPRTRKTNPKAPGADGAGIGHNTGADADAGTPKLTMDEERKLFLHHRTQWNTWKAKRVVVDTLERDVKATLKGDGFTVKQMQIADELTTVKGEKKVTGEVQDRFKVARWIGHPMGAQLDLFNQPDRTPIAERAYDQGKQASMEDKPASPQYAPETEAYRQYMAGYHDHQRELAGGIKAPRAVEDSTLANAKPQGQA